MHIIISKLINFEVGTMDGAIIGKSEAVPQITGVLRHF